jgi:hypothetical protein
MGHGTLVGVYWWQAIAAAIEIVVVAYILFAKSDWHQYSVEAQLRNEAHNNNNDENNDNVEALLGEDNNSNSTGGDESNYRY